MAQVAVHNQNPFSLHGKGGSGIHSQERLAAARIERGNQGDTSPVLVLLGIKNKFQIGTQYAECFIDIPFALTDDNFFGRLRWLFLLATYCQWNLPDKRYGK